MTHCAPGNNSSETIECRFLLRSLSASGRLQQNKTDGVFGSFCHTVAYRPGWTSCVSLSRGGDAWEGTGCWQRAKNTGGGVQREDWGSNVRIGGAT